MRYTRFDHTTGQHYDAIVCENNITEPSEENNMNIQDLSASELNHETTIEVAAYYADQLGSLRAQIKVLQDKAKEAEGFLKESELASADGLRYHVAVVRADRKSVDWKAICAKLDPSYQLVSAYTRVKPTVSVRVSAHKKS